MSATAARAQFIRQQFRSVTNGPVSGVVTAWGDLARKTTEPIPTFFETSADAQTICDERMTLLSASRRRMTQEVQGEDVGLGIDYTTSSPTATVIDDDRLLDAAMLFAEIGINFGTEKTTLETWG